MRGKLRAHLSYANVIGTLALFVALGGVSYAAVNLPNNSVGSGEIKKNAVKAAEIAKNAVGSPDVKNKSLKCVDLAPAACAAQTATPTPGDGPGNVVVRSNTATLAQSCVNIDADRSCSSQPQPVTASCLFGERATGGGFEGMGEDVAPVSRSSSAVTGGHGSANRPEPRSGTPTAWTVMARGNSFRSGSFDDPPAPTFTVYVVCAS